MSGAVGLMCALAASMCAGVAAGAVARLWGERKKRAKRRETALGSSPDAPVASDVQGGALRYAESLTRRLFTGSTEPISPHVRSGRAGATRLGAWYKGKALAAGCSKDITVSAFCEASLRMSLAAALGGAFLGMLLSGELAVVLGVAGALVGRFLPLLAVRRAVRQRALGAELHLSEMLEVVALGLRSGLTFDRSFALYGIHFDSELARTCMKTYRSWSLGLCTREEALREFAESYECDQLSRVVDSIVRSLRFGSALAGILEESGSQARAAYRAALEERVAKAPVKMMLPTGALILPAMLLMVMGPVLLELAGGF